MKIIEGNLLAKDLKFGIIISRFNDLVSKRLLDGCMDYLVRHGGKEDDIDIVWVPGSYEIPMVAKKLALSGKYQAIICLGVIIRGDTPHFEYIASEVSKGIALVNLETGIPAIFGIITSDTIEQAIERAGAKSGNKGRVAAESAIEMANLLKEIK